MLYSIDGFTGDFWTAFGIEQSQQQLTKVVPDKLRQALFQGSDELITGVFVNDKQRTGFLLYYVAKPSSPPSEWLIALIDSCSDNPKLQKLSILTTQDPANHIKNHTTNCSIREVVYGQNPLLSVDAPDEVKALIKHLLHIDPTNNRKISLQHHLPRLGLLLKIAGTGSINSQGLHSIQWPDFFSENKGLDALTRYQQLCQKYDREIYPIPISFFIELMSGNNVYKKALERLSDRDERNYLTQVEIIVACYKKDVFLSNQAWIEKKLLAGVPKGECYTPVQIEMIALMLHLNFEPDLVEKTIKSKYYYTALFWLNKMGLAKKYAERIQEQADLLPLLDNLPESIKKVTLLLWVYASLNRNELNAIIENLKADEAFADVLLAMCRLEEDRRTWILGINCDRFKKYAASADEMQRLYTSYELCRLYGNDAVKHLEFTGYAPLELRSIREAFRILHAAHQTFDPEKAAKILDRNEKGRDLRMFSAFIEKSERPEYKKALIDFLFMTEEQQIKQIKTFSDPEVSLRAQRLHERCICVNELRELQFSDTVISFVADASVKSVLFHKMYLNIHQQVEIIRAQMQQRVSPETFQNYLKEERIYKQSLYDIAYRATNETNYCFVEDLKRAQQRMLDMVDPQTATWLQQSLIIIANIFITLLTMGVANDIKEQKTGNYWFFTHTRAGEEVYRLGRMLTVTMADPVF